MRIAVLSRNFSPTGGGAERYSIALVEQLAQRHEIHVFAQTMAQHIDGVTYHRVHKPCERPRWINQLWFALETWWRTRRGFDVVHSHENTWHGAVQTVHVLPVKHTLFDGKTGAARVLRWLKVLSSPRLAVYMALEAARYAPLLRRTVVSTSAPLQRVMTNTYPKAAPMCAVVAPGVAQAPGRGNAAQRAGARVRLGLPVQGFGILFVGNDFVKKGLPTALHALKSLISTEGDEWLAVVGKGEHEASMRSLVQSLGLADSVFFVGALTQMDDAYCAADALLHPTLEDTYAMVVLEAMAHGLPVVVSAQRFCGIAAELSDGHNALVVQDPTQPQEVIAALQRLRSDAALVARLSSAATDFARERTWAEAAQHYEAIYQKAAPVFKQRWLVLAHAFNMDGRAASQTITDKLVHLERAGIEVVVLSGVSGRRDAHYEHLQLWPAGPAGIRFEMRHVLRKRWGSGLRYRAVMLPVSLLLLPLMLVEKLLRPVESSWSWWLSAYLAGRSLCRKRQFDLIYSTGGAFAAHLAGAALKKATGLRWLAEVHDPMVVPGTTSATPTTAQQKMQARVETTICKEADAAIWFTEQALASARQRNPQLGARGHMMLPGVDAPPFALQPYQPGDTLVIGHFGSLSLTRNLVSTIEAIDHLMDRRPELLGRVELHVYGGPLDSLSDAAAQQARHPCVRHFGRIEADPVSGKSGREQILQRMRSADVLLLLHGVEPICAEYIPSKLYEYLWMQRPILATAHANPQMAGMLDALGHQVVLTDGVEPQAVAQQLSQALQAHVDRWLASGLPDNGVESPYTTAASVQVLMDCVGDAA